MAENRGTGSIDPKSLLLSQFSCSDQPQFLELMVNESFVLERGPRYKAYADLRESKLRMRLMKQPIIREEEEYEESIITPPKKQGKMQGSLVTPPRRSKGCSVLAQSVPDFSSALRKENRKPPGPMLPPSGKSVTPPPVPGVKSGRFVGGVGSKSLNSGDKRSGGGLMARKSYASLEEFKGLASAARTAINGGENRGLNGRSSRTGGKTVLGYRQL